MDIKDLKDSELVVTPEQAVKLKELGFRQITKWAYSPDSETGDMALYFEPTEEGNAAMKAFDWSTETKDPYFAAPDYMELIFIMETLDDYYVCGRVLRGSNQVDNLWWADTMTNATECTDESTYAVYGNTPAEAMGNMLIKEIELGKAPINWMYFSTNRLKGKGMRSYRGSDHFGDPNKL